MKFLQTRDHQYWYRCLTDLIFLIAKYFWKISTHFFYDYLINSRTDMNTACVGVKKHFWVEQFFKLCCLINIDIIKSKNLILVDRVAKEFEELRFDFFIFNIQSIEDKVEFPNFLDFKVLNQKFPVFVYLVDQFEVWLHQVGHFW